MQKFLFSIFLVTGLSWSLLLFFAAKTAEESVFLDLSFSFFLFWALSFSLSLLIYFARIFLVKIAGRRKIKLEEEEETNLRPLWRRSFKMAAVVSVFVAFLAFLKLEEQLNLFNLILLALIVIVGAIFLRMRS